jgi:ABC-type multidrug transport system ATPase subunit
LLSTHLLEDVEEVCDRVLFLRSGELVGDEPVRPDSGPGNPRRALRLRFANPVTADDVARAAGGEGRATSDGPLHVTLRFAGGDREQAALVASVVRAGLPLVAAAAPDSDLARRYLERVGREDVR